MEGDGSAVPDRLLQAGSALLDTTMDQLRTLIAVHETGTALAAGRLLGREQSSVQKQLDTLNRNFGTLCGEPLVRKQGRGRDVLFTGTGRALVALARRTLDGWADGVEDARRRLGSTLCVGSTRYTLGYLLDAVEPLTGEFERRGVDFRLVHVRTRDLLDKLRAREIDLVCGSTIARTGADPGLDGFEVMEWNRSDLALVTNLPAGRLPGPAVATSRLAALPLAVPADGLISAFLRGWFGPRYRDKVEVVAEIDTLQYGLELLGSHLVTGCMLVTQGLGEAVRAGRLAAGTDLRVLDLHADTQPRLEVLVGAFARAGEPAGWSPGHPLSLIWNRLGLESRAYHSGSPGPEGAARARPAPPRTG